MKTRRYKALGLMGLAISIFAFPQTSALATNFAILLSGDSGDVLLDDCVSAEIDDLIIEVVKERDAATGEVLRKRPGKVKYSNITLRAAPGSAASGELQSWWREISKGKDIRKSITINLRADRKAGFDDAQPRYTFFNGRPEEFFLTEEPGLDGVPSVLENYLFSSRGLHLDAGKAFQPPKNVRAKIALEHIGRFSVDNALTGWSGGEPAIALGFLHNGTRYHEPTDSPFVTNLILKKENQAGSEALYDWINILVSGEDPVGTLEITEARPNGRPGRKFTYHEAWPCRWKAPELNSNSDTYIVEELEFAVERVERG